MRPHVEYHGFCFCLNHCHRSVFSALKGCADKGASVGYRRQRSPRPENDCNGTLPNQNYTDHRLKVGITKASNSSALTIKRLRISGYEPLVAVLVGTKAAAKLLCVSPWCPSIPLSSLCLNEKTSCQFNPCTTGYRKPFSYDYHNPIFFLTSIPECIGVRHRLT